MKKVFISQPMRGMKAGEIAAARAKAIEDIYDMIGEEVEVIDSHFEDLPDDANPVYYLGRSIQKLSEADIAYFLKGWDKARGCRNEQRICVDYGIETIYE